MPQPMQVPPAMGAPPGGAPPPPGAGGPPGAGPAAGPMMTPQPPKGHQEGAKVDVIMGIKMLERALPVFGSSTDEGKAVLKAIQALTKSFGKQQDETEELMPGEMKTLLAGLSGPGAAGPPPGAGGPPPGGPPGAGAPPPG